ARALASYALLQAYTGFHYSAVTKTLQIKKSSSWRTTFFSTATAFGTITVNGHEVSVHPIEGHLDVEKIELIE
ncbi:MAG TPA: hypothetical protein VK171_04330, partial [Fimbriimonas sp.]|nr:hypothetical protein [Fimbriimonas sp.]